LIALNKQQINFKKVKESTRKVWKSFTPQQVQVCPKIASLSLSHARRKTDGTNKNNYLV